MASHENDRLLVAAQRGSAAALESLLKTNRQAVFRYGLRYCKTSEDAEDAVQETLWAATRSLGGFRRAAAITTWLFTIVRNKCHRLSRRHNHDQDLADVLPAIPDPMESLDGSLAAHQVQCILAQALATLDPSYREAILLRDVEGLTAPEAADRLGISIQALKSRLHRARLMLREAVVQSRFKSEMAARNALV
jgi:RNA polymerase sigma-70 factor (ECF subfamily)